jgi:hypothetical protein
MYITIFFSGRNLKSATSVYTLGEFHKNRNNSTVFEELSVSIVDLTVANICFTGSASHRIAKGIIYLASVLNNIRCN